MESGSASILDIVQAPDFSGNLELELPLEPLRQSFVSTVQEIERLHRKSQLHQQKLLSISPGMKPKQHRKLRMEYARLVVQISRLIRSINFTSQFRRSLKRRAPKRRGGIAPSRTRYGETTAQARRAGT